MQPALGLCGWTASNISSLLIGYRRWACQTPYAHQPPRVELYQQWLLYVVLCITPAALCPSQSNLRQPCLHGYRGVPDTHAIAPAWLLIEALWTCGLFRRRRGGSRSDELCLVRQARRIFQVREPFVQFRRQRDAGQRAQVLMFTSVPSVLILVLVLPHMHYSSSLMMGTT